VDPAIVDRRTTHLPGIAEADLPVRTMSIAGLEGKLAARILSKDMTGPATRIVRFQGDWGSRTAGAFTADVSLLVVSGRVRIGEEILDQHDFAYVPQRCEVPGIRAEDGTLALLLTGGPVSYDTTSGGISGAVEVVHSGDIPWETQRHQSGRLVKRLSSTGRGDSWLNGWIEWSGAGGPWHRHPVDEEVFVLDGSITLSELGDQGPEAYTYLPGGYVWRPADILHAGPGSSVTDMAITFHHTSGDLETECVDDQNIPTPYADDLPTVPNSHLES